MLSMKSSIKLKNGDEWYLMYSYQNDHLLEILPFQYTNYELKQFLPDGRYELMYGGYFIIKNKKIDYINYG